MIRWALQCALRDRLHTSEYNIEIVWNVLIALEHAPNGLVMLPFYWYQLRVWLSFTLPIRHTLQPASELPHLGRISDGNIYHQTEWNHLTWVLYIVAAIKRRIHLMHFSETFIHTGVPENIVKSWSFRVLLHSAVSRNHAHISVQPWQMIWHSRVERDRHASNYRENVMFLKEKNTNNLVQNVARYLCGDMP